MTQALDHVKGQEASLTALKLAALTLGVGHAQTQVGRSGWVAVCMITDFVSLIQSMVLTLPLALHLCLSLPSLSQEECGFTRAAMDKVQTSYLGSLQELGDLLRKRADSLKSLKI